MVVYHRLPGTIAVVALLYRAHLRAVPSDPGDAHPLRAGKSLRAAVEEGRRRAFPSIAYSNAAMILTAGILFYFGTGTVKGFALTLGIGVAVSFFTAVIVTQMLLHGVIEFTRLRRRALYGVEDRPPKSHPGREPRVAAVV